MIIIDFLALGFAQFLGGLAGERISRRAQRAQDRKGLTLNRIRCGIRAVEGRVHNIGTEWSSGWCEVGGGHIRFVPTMGIVGERDIDVISLGDVEGDVSNSWHHAETLNYFRLTTASGALYWAVPPVLADEAAALILAPG